MLVRIKIEITSSARQFHLKTRGETCLFQVNPIDFGGCCVAAGLFLLTEQNVKFQPAGSVRNFGTKQSNCEYSRSG